MDTSRDTDLHHFNEKKWSSASCIIKNAILTSPKLDNKLASDDWMLDGTQLSVIWPIIGMTVTGREQSVVIPTPSKFISGRIVK